VKSDAQRALGQIWLIVHGALLDERGKGTIRQAQVVYDDRVVFDVHARSPRLGDSQSNNLGGFHAHNLRPGRDS
jgi:hypothetical protein